MKKRKKIKFSQLKNLAKPKPGNGKGTQTDPGWLEQFKPITKTKKELVKENNI